jgi:hypothetical protein
MFRKPQINISLSRTPKAAVADDTITETVNSIDWERISVLTQETAKKVAMVAVAAYAAKKAIDTTSEITIVAATHAITN